MTLKANFAQWLKKIEGENSQICLGLDRVTEVGIKANVLRFSCPVVTVAGTNGKGSTVAALSTLLQNAGLKVGTYTSPHLFDFKERAQINGKCVDENTWCEAFNKIESCKGDIPLTFFEFTTLAAFEIFQQPHHQLDIVVLEIGLGGRQDAVNVIAPTVAIVTTIGLDHQDYLGTTLESIASEKAGIFRAKQHAVIGRMACIPSLLAKAKALEVSLTIEGEHFDYDEKTQIWHIGNETNINIQHYLPTSSVSLAMAAYTILDKHYISLPKLDAKSLESKVMVGRCYPVVLNNKPVIFDVAHNPQGSQWLATTIKRLAPGAKICAVWASMTDKDLVGIAKPMSEVVCDWYIGKVQDNLRCALNDELETALVSCEAKAIHVFDNINEAFNKALTAVHDLIVVFGSFYTVSQVMSQVSHFEMNNGGLSGIEKILPNASVKSEC